MRYIFSIIVLALTALPLTAQVKTAQGELKGILAADLFTSLLTQIKKNTNLQILFPDELPPIWKKYPLYSYSESDADEWKISVGTEPNCGVNVCFVGFLSAERGENDEYGEEVVKLAQGIKGHYTGKSCGGSCAPPQVTWKDKNVLYTLQFRVESGTKKEDKLWIIKMANSAILQGAR